MRENKYFFSFSDAFVMIFKNVYSKSLQFELLLLLFKKSNSLGMLISLSFSIFMPAEPQQFILFGEFQGTPNKTLTNT